MGWRQTKLAAVAAVGLAASAGGAAAHHGWSWTEDAFFEIEGRVTDVYVGNPHATVELEAGGETWRIELAPPRQTEEAGFTEDAVKPGDLLKAVGHRSLDAAERRIKAVRVISGGRTYDVYPARLPAD